MKILFICAKWNSLLEVVDVLKVIKILRYCLGSVIICEKSLDK